MGRGITRLLQGCQNSKHFGNFLWKSPTKVIYMPPRIQFMSIIITHLGDQKYLTLTGFLSYSLHLPANYLRKFPKTKLTSQCREMSPQCHSEDHTDAVTSLSPRQTLTFQVRMKPFVLSILHLFERHFVMLDTAV